MRPFLSRFVPGCAMGGAAALAATCAVLVPTQATAINGCGLPVVDTNTYAVSTEADLRLLSASCNLAYDVRQLADIDLSSGGAFPPIGSLLNNFTPRSFTGTYDGGGHSITGLLVTEPAGFGAVGLFGQVNGATIRNLTVSGSASSPPGHPVGILVGEALNTSISAVHTSGTATGTSSTGGVVGNMNGTSITRSSSSAAVSAPSAGGIVGRSFGGSITDSYATGAIRGGTESLARLGGIVAEVASESPTSIDRTYFTGTLTPNAGAQEVYTGGTVGSITMGQGSVGSTGLLATATTTGNVWNSDTTGAAGAGSGVGTGKTTAEMKQIGTYTAFGWSIVNGWEAAGTSTWGICPQVNDGYPFLQGQTPSTACKAPDAVPTAAALTATLLPSRRRVVSGQRLRIGIRTANSGGTAAASVTSCVRLPVNLVITSAAGAVRSGRTACFRMGTVAAGAKTTKVLTVRAVSARRVKVTVTGSARASGVATAQAAPTSVTVTPRRARARVTG